MADVVFNEVDKVYENGFHAVQDLSLEVADGEFLVLVGPSGCGKTTALRMVAGLEDISGGEIFIGDRLVNKLTPKERDVAMVFQNYALYPHLSVYENIAFGLRLRKAPKDEVHRQVSWAAKMLDLAPYLDRKPKQLSGGQRQRVAMGRAIVRQPQVFLMDEPLSNLDAKLRVQMRAEIGKLQHDLGTTTIYVTHDQVEAMTMGDRVAVMRKGELQQVDDPQVLYDRPLNLFVGGFIGSPAMNMLDATIEASNGDLAVKAGKLSIRLGDETLSARPALKTYAGKNLVLGIRPEDLEDANLASDTPKDQRLTGTVELREALGAEIMAHFSVEAEAAETDETRELARDKGDADGDVGVSAPEGKTVLVGRFGARSKAKEGDKVEVAVDTRALHFFDPETGLGIYDSKEKGAGA
jgi:multiple sugar transport system ATP-binding protein